MMPGLIFKMTSQRSHDTSRHTTYDAEIVWLNILIVYMTSHGIPGFSHKYNLRLWNVPFQNLILKMTLYFSIEWHQKKINSDIAMFKFVIIF